LKNFILNFLFLFLTISCYSQNGVLTGEITDTENQNLIGSNILLLNPADSSLYKGITADTLGKFHFNDLNFGNYILKISYVGFTDQFKKIEITSVPLALGKIKLGTAGKNLKTVTIEDKAPTAVQKGDTTQYNASSYKTNPDANAEDLITKMSGVTTVDGKVQAHGEEVKRVLVDGKPFFGDDPNAVLKNLPADVIDKIQVFDQQSDQSKFTGVNDGNTTKTINIITKPGMKNGTFGRVFSGYGYEDVYKSGANINFFNGDRRLSIIAQSNNINEQNFSAEDLAGVMSSSGQSGGGGRIIKGGGGGGNYSGGGNYGGNSSSNFLVNTKNGIAKTHAFGINYTDKWNKKLEITASYFFNYADNNADQNTHRRYVLQNDSGQVYSENSISRSQNTNHRANVKLEWKIDTMNTIIINPKFSLQQNEGKNNVIGETTLGDVSLNSTTNNYTSNILAYSLSNELQYQHKLKKTGRTFSITLNTGYNSTDANSNLYASNYYYTDTTTSIIDQESQLDKKGSTIGANISYTEPFGTKSILQFSYINSFNFTENNKETFNFSAIDDSYSDPDTLLTNIFKSEYDTHKGGLSYRFNNPKIQFNASVNYQYAILKSTQTFPYSFDLTKTYSDVLPSAMLKINFTTKKSLRIMYRTQTTQPSIDQLQNVLNNTNPLQLSIGNADLKQNYENTVFMRYSSSNTEKATSFFGLISGTFTDNYISYSTYTANNDTIIDGVNLTRGTQLTKPINMSGYMNLRSFITYGLPLTFIKTNLNINANVGYAATPGLVNDQKNLSVSNTYGAGLTLSSNISKDIDFTISTNSAYTIIENTLNNQLNSSYLNQTSKAKLNLIFFSHLVFSTDVTHQYYDGLSAGYNENFLLWNASLGYKFMKEQKAEIRFGVNDILAQNTSVSRNTTETYIEDVQTNVLQRFYMLTFTYNIKKFKKKEEK